MIMNMYSLLEANNGSVTMEQVENAFGGNICRCTGYRPILDAFKALAIDTPIDDIEDAPIACCHRQKTNSRYRHISIGSIGTPLSRDHSNDVLRLHFRDGRVWYRVLNLHQLFEILDGPAKNEKYMLVAGNTAHGEN